MPFDCLCISTTSGVLTGTVWAVIVPCFRSNEDTRSRRQRRGPSALDLEEKFDQRERGIMRLGTALVQLPETSLAKLPNKTDLACDERSESRTMAAVEIQPLLDDEIKPLNAEQWAAISVLLGERDTRTAKLEARAAKHESRIEKLESSLAEQHVAMARVTNMQKALAERTKARVKELEDAAQGMTSDISVMKEQFHLNKELVQDLDDQVEVLEEQLEVMKWESSLKGVPPEPEPPRQNDNGPTVKDRLRELFEGPSANASTIEHQTSLTNALRTDYWQRETCIQDIEAPAQHYSWRDEDEKMDKRIRQLASQLSQPNFARPLLTPALKLREAMPKETPIRLLSARSQPEAEPFEGVFEPDVEASPLPVDSFRRIRPM